MSSPAAPQSDQMYSTLIEDEGPDEFSRRSKLSHKVVPASVHVGLRQRGQGLYRPATICLAALCVILLISVIAVYAHFKNKHQSATESSPDTQKLTKEANVSALLATINNLKEQNKQLWARLNATKAPTPAPIECPADWLLFNSSCYFISRMILSWSSSQSYCQRQGAHLAIILTAEEQTFIWNLLPRGHWNAFWIGITDSHTEDEWKWVDGTPLVGGFWEEGEPNNHIDEDCGNIIKTNVLTRVAVRSWYDAPCSMSRYFICEKEIGPGVSTASITVPHNDQE